MVTRFVLIELLVGIVGGFSALVLFLAFTWTDVFRPVLYGMVTAIGILVGLEIPLLMRILRERFSFKDVVANVLTFDYAGALVASLLFPLLLVPRLGLVRSSLLFGLVNVLVAFWSTWLFRDVLPQRRALQWASLGTAALLAAGLWQGQAITTFAEEGLYADPVILARDTRYQRIVLTNWKDDLRLYLNGHLQFASRDEYRYHEALVHPGLAALPLAKRVLVLGGGDGLAVREILKHPQVESVTLVDLDAEMTTLFASHDRLTALNAGALADPRVRVVNADAFVWLDGQPDTFDFIVIDFPDPSNYHVGKLYTSAFYRLVRQHLASDGFLAVQSTSPLFARKSFWSIVATLQGGGAAHVSVPRVRAELRRVGVRDRRRRAIPAAAHAAWRPALPHGRRDSGALRLSGRHGTRGGAPQPTQRPGARALLRAGVGGDQPLMGDVTGDVTGDVQADAQTAAQTDARQDGAGDPGRRAFLLQLGAALTVLLPLAAGGCAADGAAAGGAGAPPRGPALVGLARKGGRPIAGGFVEDDAAAGHAVRDGAAAPSGAARERRRVAVAIVGGGVGGLSAGWRLDALGVRDWLLLELASEPGGNAQGGANAVSRYPWGAHYLPVPSPHAEHVRTLLRETGVLHADGTWDERTLCHTPQERLWMHGRWHEGLEPLDAAPAWERAEWTRFDAQVAEWRASGAFRVPLAGAPDAVAGADAAATHALDGVTGAEWMRTNGYRSPTLRWWLDYSTRDDYGTALEQASAWATAHYFAGRDANEEGPLTWPEGNAFLVRHLAARAGDRVRTGAPVQQAERRGARWLLRTPSLEVECDVVIWAAPLFVLPHVPLSGSTPPLHTLPVHTDYAPWVVANLTLDRRPAEKGAAPAWDNVIHGSTSLGYVSATHQSLGRPGPESVWTWYHAVVDREPAAARRWLAARSWPDWRDEILADLARAHPDIAECVTRVDVRRWGHAMARPVPGLLARRRALAAWQPAPRWFVAHADLSGFSVFEEAQWHGVQAAEAARRVLSG